MENHPSRNHRFHQGMENHHHPSHQNHRFHEGMGNHPSPNRNHRCEEFYDMLLSMNIHCCEECPRVLEKFLRRLRVKGVENFSIVDTDLIKVSGTIEPETLLEQVKKLGKRVKLVPMEELARRKKNTQELMPADNKKEPHICSDDYKPPDVNPLVCRDFLCKLHPRSRPIYGNKLEDESFPFFGFSPFGPSTILSGYEQPMPYGYQQPPPYGYPQPQYPQIFPPQ